MPVIPSLNHNHTFYKFFI